MSRPPKSVFVTFYIVIPLIGLNFNTIHNNENKELEEEEPRL